MSVFTVAATVTLTQRVGDQAPVSAYTRDPSICGTAQVSIGVGDGAMKTLNIDEDILTSNFNKVPGIADKVWQDDGSIV